MRLTYWVLIIVLVGAHFSGYSPIGAVFDVLGRCWVALRPHPSTMADDGLLAAMKNATNDYDQLADIVRDFIKQSDRIDPHAEERFMYFLQERAGRNNQKLERALDWLLAIYKIAFPFLVCLMVARVSSGKDVSGSDEPPKIKALHSSRASSATYHSAKDFTPSLNLLDSPGTYAGRGSSSHRHLLEHSRRERSGSDLAMRASGF